MESPLDIVVEDTFRIDGRGTVTAGIIRSGELRVCYDVSITRADGRATRATVRSIDISCGPNVRRDAVGFLLDPHDDAFVRAGSVIKYFTEDAS